MKTQQVKIQIPEPCHEDWNKMTPKDKGAFCSSCEKVVVDFTKMSDRQIVDFLNENKGKKTCGKFNNYQVNRDIVVATPPANYYWRMKQFFVGLFVSLSFPGFAKGTEAPVSFKPLPAIDDANLGKEYVKGLVKDAEGNVIAAAYVRIYQNGRITKSYAVTNETGAFSLELPEKHQDKSIELRVTAQNYTSKSVQYNGEEQIEIVMTYEKHILGKMAFNPIEVEEVTEKLGEMQVQEEKLPCLKPIEKPDQELLGRPEIHMEEDTPIDEEVILPPPVDEIEYIDIMGDIVQVDLEDYMPKNVTGSVVDENGEPLAFATVIVENTQIGTSTDLEGNFKFEIPIELQQLRSLSLKVSSIGYENQTIVINTNDAVENEIVLKIALSEPAVLMGVMIYVPDNKLKRPSGFDENYQVPAWKEAGFESRRAYNEHLKNNQ